MEFQQMSDKITTMTTYGASFGAIVLTFINEYAAAMGIFIALATFILNAWFKYQHLQLAIKVAQTKKENLDGYIEQ